MLTARQTFTHTDWAMPEQVLAYRYLDGRHVVSLERFQPGRSQRRSTVWRFGSVEAARARWREVRAWLQKQGYTPERQPK